MAIKLPTCQWFKSFLLMPTCENVLGQETETQIAPIEQASCMAAAAIGV